MSQKDCKLRERKPEQDPSAINSSDSTASRDQMVKVFKKLLGIFDDFSMLLIPFITLKHSDGAKYFFMKHYNLIMALVLTIVLYFSSLVIGTILQLYNRNLLLIVNYTIIMLGSAASILALSLISPTIAWITLASWVGIFTMVVYFKHEKLRVLISSGVPEIIKNWIEI